MQFLKFAFALAFLIAPFTARAATEQGTANAEVVTPLAIDEISTLSFGKFTVGASGGSIDQDGSTSGDVNSVAPGNKGQFAVTGAPNTTYSTAGSDAMVALEEDGPGTATMNASLNYPATPSLNGLGQSLLEVGGSLTVPGSTPGGSYSGTYNMTVNY